VARNAKKGVTDPFRSFKKGDGGLGDIFKTPDDILFKGSFDDAACAAESSGKLLLVNIQDETQFASHLLNRDTWANETVKNVIQTHFIFWQQYVSSPQGDKFRQFYKVGTLPSVMILDADTRAKLKEWEGYIEPDVLLDQTTAFVEQLETQREAKRQRAFARMAASKGCGVQVSAPKKPVESSPAVATTAASRPLTEEEEIEAAIRASLEGANGEALGNVSTTSSAAADGADSLDAARTRLGPEPDETETGVTTLMFRLPDGQQIVRRFLASRPTQDAFDFLEMHGCAPGTYDMIFGFPPKKVTDGKTTIADAELLNAAFNVRPH